MREVTILSPHRDDAVFSLAITTRNWCNAGTRVRVVNFFTYSAYAPRAVGSDSGPGALSSFRKREDRLALRSLHPAIEVQDWSLFDAPLRLDRATVEVMRPNATPVRAADVRAVSQRLPNGYAVAPLGLGDHVDHRTVRDAATEQFPPHRLAFYEDLPYAAWTSEDEIRVRVAEIERTLRRQYRRLITHTPKGRKRRLAALYATQITPEVAANIAGRHERIWVPAHSSAWNHARSI